MIHVFFEKADIIIHRIYIYIYIYAESSMDAEMHRSMMSNIGVLDGQQDHNQNEKQ